MPRNYDTYNPFEEEQPRRRRYAQTYGQSPLASTGDTGIPDPGPTTDIGIPGVDPWTGYRGTPETPYTAPPQATVPEIEDVAQATSTGDPARDAVLAAFAAKGLPPTDAEYWVRRINEEGGWDNPARGKDYWLKRMAYKYGGVGDYTDSGKVGNENDYTVDYNWLNAMGKGAGQGGGNANVSQAPIQGEPTPASDPGFDAAIKAMILKLLQGGSSDPYADPVNKGALSAYDAQQTRNADTMRNAIGERAAAEGTYGTGGYTNQLLGAEQTAGENKATFAANLATRTLERQRTELMSALSLGAGVMSAEQQRALTAKIADIDAAIRQQSVTNQNNQFNQNLGWSQDQWTWLQNLLPYMQGT